MKTYKYTYIVVLGILFLASSCEMRKDLTGHPGSSGGKNPKGTGSFQLTLNAEKEADIPLKAGDNETLDPNLFHVAIFDEANNIVRQYDTYKELADSGSVKLPSGSYTVKANWGDLADAAFDAPYYEGKTPFTINPQEVSTVQTDCKLSNVKISIDKSGDFLENFRDDYVIVLTNGTGILTQKHKETRTAYFKKENILDLIIHATTTDGQKVTYSKNLYDDPEVSEHNNISINLDAIAEIEVPDPGTDPEEPAITIKLVVDISLIEKEYIIEIPPSILEPEEPQPGDTPTITGPGLSTPIEITVGEAALGETKVNLLIETPDELKNLKVYITATSDDFIEALEEMELAKEFDMMNLTPTQSEMLTTVGLNPPTDDYSNIFDISEFVPMLSVFGAGEYRFKLTATDKKNQSTVKTLTIILTN